MAIAIPTLIDTQIAALQASMRSSADDTAPSTPYAPRLAADILRILTDLIDSAELTATGGTALEVQDTGAYTGVDSLVGSTVTFAADTTTPGLQGKSAVVKSNTTGALVFERGALPARAAALVGGTQTFPFNETSGQTLVIEQTDDGGATWTAGTRTFTYSTSGSAFAEIADLLAELNTAAKWDGTTLPTTFTITNSGDKLVITPVSSDPLAGIRVAAASTGTGVTADEDLLWADDVTDMNTEFPISGDTYVVSYTAADAKLDTINDKGLGARPSSAAGGPALLGAMMLILEQLGASVPAYLTAAAAEPFGSGSPHAEGVFVADAIELVRDAIAAHTAPA
jgi:hypothetical protein